MRTLRCAAVAVSLSGRGAVVVAGEAVASPGRVLRLSCAYDGRRLADLWLIQHPADTRVDDRKARAFATHCAIAVARERRHDDSATAATLQPEGLDELLLCAEDLADFTTGLAALLSEALGPVRAGLMTWDAELERLQTLPGFFGVSHASAVSYQIDVASHASNSARVFSSRVPCLSNAPRGDPAMLQEWVLFFKPRRIVTVPLCSGERSFGVLHVADKQSPFTLADVAMLEQMGPRIARALTLMQELIRSRRQQRLERVLSDVALKIVAGESMQATLSRACAAMRGVAEAEAVAITLVGGPPIGAVPPEADRSPSLAATLAAAKTQPHASSALVHPTGAGDPGRAHLYVPIELGGKRIGTLSAVRARAEPFDVDERDALGRLGQLAALAWAADGYRRKRDELLRVRERHRLADDLHDDVAQLLFVAQMRIDAIVESAGLPEDLAEPLRYVRGVLAQGDVAIREVIEQLAPTTRGELSDRLMTVVEDVVREFQLPVRILVADEVDRLASGLRLAAVDAIVRVAREALLNACKHAGPCHAIVDLKPLGGALVLTVTDDGVGPSAEATSRSNRHGLASLRRAVHGEGGELDVGRGPAGGVCVKARFEL